MNFQDSPNQCYEISSFNSLYPNFYPDYQGFLNCQHIIAENMKLKEKELKLENKIQEVEKKNCELACVMKNL